jgi:hypothetical protein
MAFRHGVAIMAAIVLSACGGGGEGSTEPPPPPPPPPPAFTRIEINDTLTRTLRTTGVADTLRYVATGPGRIHIDLQQMVSDAQLLTMQYVLIDSTSRTIVGSRAGALGRSSPLANPDLIVSWAALNPGTYLIIVNELSLTFTGDYRIRVIGVADSRPESAKATLAPGDSVTDAIDDFGDFDEYIVSLVNPSVDHIVGLRAIGTAADTLIVERPAPFGGAELVRSAGTSASLVTTPAGRLNTTTDTVRIRVRALRSHMRGGYRLAVYTINRGPERASRTITAGDTVSESHDYARDIDEFQFVGNPSVEYSLSLQGTSGNAADTVRLTMSDIDVVSPGNAPPLLTRVSNRFSGANYTVRVTGLSDQVTRGGYRFVIFAINPKPEDRAETFAIGDTITEGLGLEVDVDEFTIPVQATDVFTIYGQVVGSDTATWVQIRIIDRPGGLPPNADLRFVARGSNPPRPLRGTRYGLLGGAAGNYRLRVTGSTRGLQYRIALARINFATETADSSGALDAVLGEALDPPGDVDTFVLPCTQGDEVAAYSVGAGALLTITVPGSPGGPPTGDSPALGVGEGTGTRTVGVTGSCRVQISSEGEMADGLPVPYQFKVYRIRRGPEQVNTPLRVGDSVFVETLNPSVDTDEFQFNWQPSDGPYQVCIRETSGLFEPESQARRVMVVALNVTHPNGNNAFSYGGPTPSCAGPFTPPAAGTYGIRVQGGGVLIHPYELIIRRVP